LRRRLGLPVDRPVVLSLAALNRSHKRLDYLIDEVAQMPAPRPFLVLAGQAEPETPPIRAQAARMLGPDGYSIRTVPQAEVQALLAAADVFVLPSLGEGLPRALIEALSAGLPCVAHDYAVTRFALGEHGELADLSRRGALAARLEELVRRPLDAAAAERRRRYAFEMFSWTRLRRRYVELLRGAAVLAPKLARP
jgi:glycosyltransferase involved in cell wall biosynthesis